MAIEIIDQNIAVLAGPRADRPEILDPSDPRCPAVGARYYATDTGESFELRPGFLPTDLRHWEPLGFATAGAITTIGIIDLTTPSGGGPVNPADLQAIAVALEFHLRVAVRPLWPNMGEVRVKVVTNEADFAADNNLWPLGIVDSASALAPGSSGFHSWAFPAVPPPPPPGFFWPSFTYSPPAAGGTAPIGKPFMIVGLAEANGILTGPTPLSLIISHEASECAVDPRPFHSKWAAAIMFQSCTAIPLSQFFPIDPATLNPNALFDGAPFRSTHAMVEVADPVERASYGVTLPNGTIVTMTDVCSQDWYFQPFYFLPLLLGIFPPPGTIFDFLQLTTGAYRVLSGCNVQLQLQRSSMVGQTMPWPAVQQNPYPPNATIIPIAPCVNPPNVDPATLAVGGPPLTTTWARITTLSPKHQTNQQFTLFSSHYTAPMSIQKEPVLLTLPPKESKAHQIKLNGVRISTEKEIAPIVTKLDAERARIRAERGESGEPEPQPDVRQLSPEELVEIYGSDAIQSMLRTGV